MNRCTAWILALALAAGAAWAADTATLVKDSELKAEPFADAKTLAELPRNASVEVVKRQGAWVQVKGDRGQGWVRLLALRYGSGPAASGSSGSEAGGLFSFLGGRPRPSSPTVATGVRGLSEEDLRNTRPNPRELDRMRANAVPAADARKFADAAKLHPTDVKYLAEGGSR